MAHMLRLMILRLTRLLINEVDDEYNDKLVSFGHLLFSSHRL